MNVKVINISPELEPILSYLFPNYALVDSTALSSKFITHIQVKTKYQRDVLDCVYSDCVIISGQIYDEIWDEQKVIQECINFAKERFKSRKTKFNPSKESFLEDCKSFIIGNFIEEQESPIFELFDTVGSRMFAVNYFKLIENIPYQQVFAALLTFISKLDKESPSLYYKKKAMLLKDKLDANLIKASDAYNNSIKGDGVAECKFIMDLFV